MARLPVEERGYTFGTEWLPEIRTTTKVALLTEHLLAKAGAGHARKCRPEVAAELQNTVACHIDIHGVPTPDYVASGNDSDLAAWAARAAKFRDKQKTKAESWGVNLSNLPFKAGPQDIKKFVEDLLDKPGCVKAIDPWWAKAGWVHNGGATVFLDELDARELLEIGAGEPEFSKALPRKVKITPGTDGKLARLLSCNTQISDPWD